MHAENDRKPNSARADVVSGIGDGVVLGTQTSAENDKPLNIDNTISRIPEGGIVDVLEIAGELGWSIEDVPALTKFLIERGSIEVSNDGRFLKTGSKPPEGPPAGLPVEKSA